MAKVVGFVTKPTSGETFPISLTSLKEGSSLGDTAEGKNEEGQVDLMQAVSVTETINYEGEVTADTGGLKAGYTLTHDSKTYLIKSAEKISQAGKVQTFSGQAEHKDDATIVGFEAPVAP